MLFQCHAGTSQEKAAQDGVAEEDLDSDEDLRRAQEAGKKATSASSSSTPAQQVCANEYTLTACVCLVLVYQ